MEAMLEMLWDRWEKIVEEYKDFPIPEEGKFHYYWCRFIDTLSNREAEVIERAASHAYTYPRSCSPFSEKAKKMIGVAYRGLIMAREWE